MRVSRSTLLFVALLAGRAGLSAETAQDPLRIVPTPTGCVVVLDNVPPNSTVVGIPGRVVKGEGVQRDAAHMIDLEHRLPDPVAKAIGSLADYVQSLEKRVNELSVRQGGLEERHAEDDEVLRKVKELLKNSGM